MHRHHGVEILDLHFGEALVAQDAGIGDQNVDPAPLIHGLLDEVGNTGVVGHRGAIGDGFTASRLDLRHHGFGRGGGAAGAIHRAAQIVDHHLGAARGKLKRVGAAKTPARTGDNCDFAVKTNGHGSPRKGCIIRI